MDMAAQLILFSAYVMMINVDTEVFKHIITALFNCLIYHSASICGNGQCSHSKH